MIRGLSAVFFVFLNVTFCLPGQVAYFKYFSSERDFIADNEIRATARIGIPHLEAAYNEFGQPLLVTDYDKIGIARSYELYSYDPQGKLSHRAELDSLKNVFRVTEYGEQEAWSRAFRDYSARKDVFLDYNGQNSTFSIQPNGRIKFIVFKTVGGFAYGQIRFIYYTDGRLLEETWEKLPQKTVVRRYRMAYDGDKASLKEFGRDGSLVSSVGLAYAPADQLYKLPPPRTGNILDEVALILEQITRSRDSLPYSALIPKTTWDRLILTNGEEKVIKFISLRDKAVHFTLPPDEDELSIPLIRVQAVMDRYGERIYP